MHEVLSDAMLIVPLAVTFDTTILKLEIKYHSLELKSGRKLNSYTSPMQNLPQSR